MADDNLMEQLYGENPVWNRRYLYGDVSNDVYFGGTWEEGLRAIDEFNWDASIARENEARARNQDGGANNSGREPSDAINLSIRGYDSNTLATRMDAEMDTGWNSLHVADNSGPPETSYADFFDDSQKQGWDSLFGIPVADIEPLVISDDESVGGPVAARPDGGLGNSEQSTKSAGPKAHKERTSEAGKAHIAVPSILTTQPDQHAPSTGQKMRHGGMDAQIRTESSNNPLSGQVSAKHIQDHHVYVDRRMKDVDREPEQSSGINRPMGSYGVTGTALQDNSITRPHRDLVPQLPIKQAQEHRSLGRETQDVHMDEAPSNAGLENPTTSQVLNHGNVAVLAQWSVGDPTFINATNAAHNVIPSTKNNYPGFANQENNGAAPELATSAVPNTESAAEPPNTVAHADPSGTLAQAQPFNTNAHASHTPLLTSTNTPLSSGRSVAAEDVGPNIQESSDMMEHDLDERVHIGEAAQRPTADVQVREQAPLAPVPHSVINTDLTSTPTPPGNPFLAAVPVQSHVTRPDLWGQWDLANRAGVGRNEPLIPGPGFHLPEGASGTDVAAEQTTGSFPSSSYSTLGQPLSLATQNADLHGAMDEHQQYGGRLSVFSDEYHTDDRSTPAGDQTTTTSTPAGLLPSASQKPPRKRNRKSGGSIAPVVAAVKFAPVDYTVYPRDQLRLFIEARNRQVKGRKSTPVNLLKLPSSATKKDHVYLLQQHDQECAQDYDKVTREVCLAILEQRGVKMPSKTRKNVIVGKLKELDDQRLADLGMALGVVGEADPEPENGTTTGDGYTDVAKQNDWAVEDDDETGFGRGLSAELSSSFATYNQQGPVYGNTITATGSGTSFSAPMLQSAVQPMGEVPGAESQDPMQGVEKQPLLTEAPKPASPGLAERTDPIVAQQLLPQHIDPVAATRHLTSPWENQHNRSHGLTAMPKSVDFTSEKPFRIPKPPLVQQDLARQYQHNQEETDEPLSLVGDPVDQVPEQIRQPNTVLAPAAMAPLHQTELHNIEGQPTDATAPEPSFLEPNKQADLALAHMLAEFVQETHVQETHVQETHVQETHVQETHVQETHVQETHVQETEEKPVTHTTSEAVAPEQAEHVDRTLAPADSMDTKAPFEDNLKATDDQPVAVTAPEHTSSMEVDTAIEQSAAVTASEHNSSTQMLPPSGPDLKDSDPEPGAVQGSQTVPDMVKLVFTSMDVDTRPENDLEDMVQQPVTGNGPDTILQPNAALAQMSVESQLEGLRMADEYNLDAENREVLSSDMNPESKASALMDMDMQIQNELREAEGQNSAEPGHEINPDISLDENIVETMTKDPVQDISAPGTHGKSDEVPPGVLDISDSSEAVAGNATAMNLNEHEDESEPPIPSSPVGSTVSDLSELSDKAVSALRDSPIPGPADDTNIPGTNPPEQTHVPSLQGQAQAQGPNRVLRSTRIRPHLKLQNTPTGATKRGRREPASDASNAASSSGASKGMSPALKAAARMRKPRPHKTSGETKKDTNFRPEDSSSDSDYRESKRKKVSPTSKTRRNSARISGNGGVAKDMGKMSDVDVDMGGAEGGVRLSGSTASLETVAIGRRGEPTSFVLEIPQSSEGKEDETNLKASVNVTPIAGTKAPTAPKKKVIKPVPTNPRTTTPRASTAIKEVQKLAKEGKLTEMESDSSPETHDKRYASFLEGLSPITKGVLGQDGGRGVGGVGLLKEEMHRGGKKGEEVSQTAAGVVMGKEEIDDVENRVERVLDRPARRFSLMRKGSFGGGEDGGV